MSKKNSDKWLDDLISKTINTGKPEFDAEKWKKKYPEEFQTLRSRAVKASAHSIRWAGILKSPTVKLAAAAVIIVAIGFFVILISPDKKVENIDVAEFTKSPTDMQTILSLNIAYRQGGIEAVDIQCKKAIEMLGPRPAEITIQQILSEFNGT